MRRVTCAECGKHYDYDRDDFCPRCGAFNLPGCQEFSGTIRGEDGLDERSYDDSFVHAEVHREKASRRALHLDRDELKKAPAAQPRKAAGSKQKNVGAKVAMIVAGCVILWMVFISVIFILL